MSEPEEDGMCEAHARRIARLESEIEELRLANDVLRRVAEFLAGRSDRSDPIDRTEFGRTPRWGGPG
ncbi:hypothetical protein ACFRAR_27490 [Kitasatospora sp. NPDC056651]|uniref:hypothetical protein n=1 Tax=Kitasatospora sp. NPDC056651 TaxID=3345892 RepID=UPI00369C571F